MKIGGIKVYLKQVNDIVGQSLVFIMQEKKTALRNESFAKHFITCPGHSYKWKDKR